MLSSGVGGLARARVRQRHVYAVRGECAGDDGTDASAARDQRDSVLKIHVGR